MTEAKIHPTACVEQGAEIGNNVTIGPFCWIEKGATIQDNCKLASHIVVKKNTLIKQGAQIHSHAILGGDPQNNRHQGGDTHLVIGENCLIRESVTMHRGSDNSRGITIIGDNCSFFANAHVAHDCVIGNNVLFSNNTMVAGHVEVGDYAVIGGGGAVHQFVRIGSHAFVGGMAALVSDLIPYGMAVGVHAHLGGLNLIGMKRSNISRKEIHAMRHAVALLFNREKTIKENLQALKDTFSDSSLVKDLINFIEVDSKRALCTPKLKS